MNWNKEFINYINVLQEDVYLACREKGFWPAGGPKDQFVLGTKIALMHEELSELLTALRHDPHADSEHIPDFTAEEEELADIIIRVFDYSAARECRLGSAILAKIEYNEGRPHKHGKAF